MSITVANLIAQVGADLTQFKLGMNEVDARLNQVKVRGQQTTATVAAMRAQAARLDSTAQTAFIMQNAMGQRRGAAMNAAFSAQQQADIARQIKELQAQRVATLAAQPKGSRTGIVQARKDLAAAVKDLQAMEIEAKRATAALDELNVREAKYAATAKAASSKSAYIKSRASNFEESVDASNDVATAMALRRQQDAAEHRTRALNAVAGTALVSGLVITGGLALGTKVGADFNLMLTNMAHNTMLSTKNIQFMNAVVEQLGVEGGANMDELAHGFRLFTDYTFSATEAANGLRTAMKGSIATGTNIADTAELLAKATKEFNLPRTPAGLDKTMSEMIETGRRSTLTMQQMIDVGGQLYATAANLGISFTEANAALITFTQHGLSGSQAATQLRNDIQKITQPSAAVRKELALLHKMTGVDLPADFTNIGLRANGLRGTFDKVVEAFNKLNKAQRAKLNVQTAPDLAEKVFPNLRGTVGALIATGTGFQDFENNYQHLVDSLDRGSQVNAMYQQSLANLNNQLGRVQNMGTILASTIANALTPSIVKIIGGVNVLFKDFNGLSESTKENDVKFIALAGAALILVGTVGKLVIGIAQLRTALITMGVAAEALSGPGLLAGLASFGLAILPVLAAVAVFGTALYIANLKLHTLDDTAEVVTQSMVTQAKAHAANAEQASLHAKQVVELVKRYNDLHAAGKDTHSILNQILALNPDLISGFDAQGKILGVVADAADKATNSYVQMRAAAALAAAQALQTDNANRAQQYDQNNQVIQQSQWSLTHGYVPAPTFTKHIAQPGEPGYGSPYTTQTDTYAPFSQSGKQDVLPNMQKASMQDLAKARQAMLAAIAANKQLNAETKKSMQDTYDALHPKLPSINNKENHEPWAHNQTKNTANDGDDSAAKSKVSAYNAALKAAQQQLYDLGKAYFDISHEGSAAEIMWDRQHGKLAELAKYSKSAADALFAQSYAQAQLNDETKKYVDAKKEADAADFQIQKRKVLDSATDHKHLEEMIIDLVNPGGKYAHLYHQAGSPRLPSTQDIANMSGNLKVGITPTQVPKGGVAPMPVDTPQSELMKKFFTLIQQLLASANAQDIYDKNSATNSQQKDLLKYVNEPRKKSDTPQDQFAMQLAEDPDALKKFTGVTGNKALTMLSHMDLGQTIDQLKVFVATGEDVAHILGDIYAANVAFAKATADDTEKQKKQNDELSKYRSYLSGKLDDSVNTLNKDRGGNSEAQGKHDEFMDNFKKQYEDIFNDPSQVKNQAAMLAAAEATYKQIAANDALDKTSKDVAEIMQKVKEANDAMSESYIHSVGDIKISASAWKAMDKQQQDTIKHLRQTADIKSILSEVMSQTADIFGKSLENLRQHGFKGFFNGVVQDFENMLFQLAVKWLESQFLQLMMNQLPSILGAIGGAASGGGGGGASSGGGTSTGFSSGPGSVTAATGSPMEKGKSYIVGENKAERLTVDEQGNMHIDNMGPGMRGPGRASPGSTAASVGDTHIHQYFNITGVQNPQQFRNTEGQIGYQSATNARRALNRDR